MATESPITSLNKPLDHTQPPSYNQSHSPSMTHHAVSNQENGSLNGFYQAIHKGHGPVDVKVEAENHGSMFSPNGNFFGAQGYPGFPFPSPSLGFSLGDTFVPWSEAGVSGLTPTAGLYGMSGSFQQPPADFSKSGHVTPMPTFTLNVSQEPDQLPVKLEHKDSVSSSLDGELASVTRVNSASSSGASAASGQLGGDQRRRSSEYIPPLDIDRSSYFTYPRPGGDQKAPVHVAMQQHAEGQEAGPQVVQPNQLFHMSHGYNFNPHNQMMNVQPGMTHHAGQVLAMEPERQLGSRASTSELSSISPAVLNSRAPRRSGSPASVDSDPPLQAISSTASPTLPMSAPLNGGGRMMNMNKRIVSVAMQSDGEDDDQEADGVEKNGMMWGMPTAAYRSLSARERKRVRNRISARTFRARRKEHLNILEQDLADRNATIKASQDEIRSLREELDNLRERLARYEGGRS